MLWKVSEDIHSLPSCRITESFGERREHAVEPSALLYKRLNTFTHAAESSRLNKRHPFSIYEAWWERETRREPVPSLMSAAESF
jgi:hypothetical protein